jgi:hypothetical protein
LIRSECKNLTEAHVSTAVTFFNNDKDLVKYFLIKLGKHIEGTEKSNDIKKLLDLGIDNAEQLKRRAYAYKYVISTRDKVSRLKYAADLEPVSGIPKLQYTQLDNERLGNAYFNNVSKNCNEKSNFTNAKDWREKACIPLKSADKTTYGYEFNMHHVIDVDNILKSDKLQELMIWAKANGKPEINFNSADNLILIWQQDHLVGNGHEKYREAIEVALNNSFKKTTNFSKRYDDLINLISTTRKDIETIVVNGSGTLHDSGLLTKIKNY